MQPKKRAGDTCNINCSSKRYDNDFRCTGRKGLVLLHVNCCCTVAILLSGEWRHFHMNIVTKADGKSLFTIVTVLSVQDEE